MPVSQGQEVKGEQHGNSENVTKTPTAVGVDMRLEVVVLPVSDVDQAKHFL